MIYDSTWTSCLVLWKLATLLLRAPGPVVVGKALEFVNAGLGMQKQGVSAKKVVISL